MSCSLHTYTIKHRKIHKCILSVPTDKIEKTQNKSLPHLDKEIWALDHQGMSAAYGGVQTTYAQSAVIGGLTIPVAQGHTMS